MMPAFWFAGTVNVFGQYVLSEPIVAVHLVSALWACTAQRLLAWYVLAEQMYT